MSITPTPSNLGKRDIHDNKIKGKTCRKRIRYEDITLTVKTNYDYSSMEDNKVFVSNMTFNKIIQNNHEENYLKIGHYLYEVETKEMDDNCIEINAFQTQNLEEFIFKEDFHKNILVKEFNCHKNKRHAPIKRAVLKLEPYGCSECEDNNKSITKIDVDDLAEFIKRKFRKQFFEKQQIVFIDYPKSQFKASITKQTFIESNKEQSLSNLWGRITQSSIIDFKCSSKNILLIKRFQNIDVNKYYFKISEINQASEKLIKGNSYQTPLQDCWKDGLSPLPLCVTFPKLVHEIKKTFENKVICVDDEEVVRVTTDWKIKVCLYKFRLTESIDIPKKNKHYTWALPFSDKVSLEVRSLSNVVFTVPEEKTTYASFMEFNILDISLKPSYENPNEKLWINIQSLLENLRRNYISLPLKGRICLEMDQNVILLELTYCIKDSQSNVIKEKDLKEIWGIIPETKIKIMKKRNLALKLVDTNMIYPLKKLLVKVQRINLGTKSDEKPLAIKESVMKEKFFHSLPEYIFQKQKLECVIDSKNTLVLYLEDYSSDLLGNFICEYGGLYKCDLNTEIVFKIMENSNLVIESDNQNNQINFEQKLFDMGIGGLSKETINFVKNIYHSRNKHKELYKNLNLKPERGALFYGPPGTGKTLLARNIGKLLEIPEINIKLIVGSDILHKYVGESEKKVRELFQAARNDQTKFGDNSPLHLLIIDEIESFLKKRKEDNRSWETSLVDAFLGELDGIKGSLNNIIVIGLTNKKELMDEAVLRPGRLGTHIHIGLPNSQGRKEIFRIHLKEIKEKNFLEEDYEVLLNGLVKITVGKSGAFIEAFVKETTKFAIENLERSLNENLDLNSIKITRNDFNQAFHSLTKKESIIQDYFTETNINPCEVKSKLKELGIIGLSENVVNAIKDLIYTRIIHNADLKKINYSFPKGLYISGPPGTGKTKLAKSLKIIFGLREEQFQYYHASTLWQKNDQNLKLEIEKIFDPIFNAAKDLEDQSPLFVVVIDGVDQLYLQSNLKSPHPFSLMNIFFSEIENLKENCSFPENLLIVYTSSYDRNLDSNFLKFSEQGVFIKLDLPTIGEREEIFKYYLEPLINENKVARIDFNRLAILSEHQTGAFIQASVSLAIKNSLKNISMNGEMQKLTMDDLIQAIHEQCHVDEWKKQLFV